MIKESRAIEIVNQEYNKNLKIIKTQTAKTFLNHKLKHTFKVYDTFECVLINLKSASRLIKRNNIIKYIKLTCLLHDIGRFNQIDNQTGEIISNQKYEHGNKGYEILKKFDILDPKILLPIKYHNKLSIMDIKNDSKYNCLDENDQKDILYISYFLRDVDKLENMKTFMLQKGFYNKREEKTMGFELKEKNVISPIILESFLNGRLIETKHLETTVDKILFYYSWCNDIFYPSSIEYLKSIGFKAFIIKLLQELKVPNVQIDQIQNKKIESIYKIL